jgi:UDP-N-acetylglucosamine 2-epimerase
MKVMTIVGTRPEIIKLSRIIPLFDRYFDHVLVHTGQNYDYELNEIFFEELGIRKPDYFLDSAKKYPAATIASVIENSDLIMRKELPDAILLYGDTNSCLSVISAKRLKIPIFHMEAGNRCFDIRVPEEINRKIVDHLSDINMPLSEHARRYLIEEGIAPDRIFKIGSPMKEVLLFNENRIKLSSVLSRENLKRKSYFLVSVHREENVDFEANFIELFESLSLLAEEYDKEIVVSTHPRTRSKLESLSSLNLKRMRFLKPFGFFDYVNLQLNSFCVLSDSGTITEESSILGFPAVTIRQMHERPEGMDSGTLIMSGLSKGIISAAVRIISERDVVPSIVSDYNVDNVSLKVLNIIISYTDFINKNTWQKKY